MTDRNVKIALGALVMIACYCGVIAGLMPLDMPMAPTAPVDYELPDQLPDDDCAIRKDCVTL